MKTDLATSILAAVIGIAVAYIVCNMFLPPLANVTFNTLSDKAKYSLTEPNPEVFNFRALNPTVEVYVGECSAYDENGECVDDVVSRDSESESSDQNQNPEGN